MGGVTTNVTAGRVNGRARPKGYAPWHPRPATRLLLDQVDNVLAEYSSPWHEDVEDFWNDTGRRIRDYRRDRQEGQRYRVELWCEAAGMAPQLARVCDEYSVPVFSSGGFASLTAVRLIAHRALERIQPTILLHVGDYDPSGESINFRRGR